MLKTSFSLKTLYSLNHFQIKTEYESFLKKCLPDFIH
jgi:hypothetical protein